MAKTIELTLSTGPPKIPTMREKYSPKQPTLNRFFVVGKIKIDGKMLNLIPLGFPSIGEARKHLWHYADDSFYGSEVGIREGLEFECPNCGHKEYSPPDTGSDK